MRKIFKAALPIALTPLFLIGVNAGSASAAVTSGCFYGSQCQVAETMNSGQCMGTVIDTGSDDVYLQYLDDNGTGYDCRFWMERNVNNTGWYNESGYLTLTPGNSYDSQNYWDGPGYQAEVCFQFLWSGTSDPGAVHCSPPITN
jgi:hypothetical protein